MDVLPPCFLKFNTSTPRSPPPVFSLAWGMPEEVKTLSESSANSTCACFEKKKREKKESAGAKLSLKVEMKEKCCMQNDCSVCKTVRIKHGNGAKENKKSFFFLMFVQ